MNNLLKLVDFNLNVYQRNKKLKFFFAIGILFMAFLLIQLFTSVNLSSKDSGRLLAEFSANIYYFTLNFLILMVPYLLQDIEQQNWFGVKYLSLPIYPENYYFSRLFLVLISLIVFTIFYMLICYLLFFLVKDSTMMKYYFLSFKYIYKLLIPSFGYVALVVLGSFYTKNLILGFAQLLICFFLSYIPELFFLPSSYGYNNLRYFITITLYPNSILNYDKISFEFWGISLFFVICFLVRCHFIKIYKN